MPQKKAVLKQIQGLTFMARGDTGHWVVMDGPKELGGMETGPRPKELLLFALAGCTASDVVSILKKKRANVEGFEIRVSATQREEHPQVFTDIHLEYVCFGDDINPADVERAIELSATKYCSVSAMLKGCVNITHSYRIEPAREMKTMTAETAAL